MSAVAARFFGASVRWQATQKEEPVAQPVDADIQSDALTIEDLKASAGKGPRLGPDDIANTYYSDEEFLAALKARRSHADGTSTS